MWKLLGYSEDNKDSNSANQAPEPITMVRSRAVVDDGRKAADGADPGDDFILSQFDAHGIKFAHPKGWGIVEEQRKIFLFHPTDRSISLNIIIGITAPGTDLDELTSQAVEMPRKLMANGALDSSSAPLAVEEVTMLGKPARSLSYKIKVSPLRRVEQSWTENRGRSFIVTRAAPDDLYSAQKPLFDKVISSLAFVSKEAEEYEPPEDERKKIARSREKSTTNFSHEHIYLSKPGVLIYSTFEDYTRGFRVRFPGIFELTPIADAPDGAPSLILRLCLHSENTKQDKDVSVKKLRDSLETMQISVTVNSKSSEVEYADDVRRRAIGADVASEETKLAGGPACKLSYNAIVDGQAKKHTEVVAVKNGKLYIVSLSYLHEETEDYRSYIDAHNYFFTHTFRQFEFIQDSTPSKANVALYQNHTTHPKISIEYDTQVYQTQPMGGPFVISLVRVPEQEGQGKGKGKGKGKQKMPSAMIGLIVAPIPDQSVYTLDKFCKMLREQLPRKGKNCRILEEEDVTIANGKMKGRDIAYISDVPPQDGMPTPKNALATPKMHCRQRIYLFGNSSYVLLFQTMDDCFDREWALAAPVFNSFQFF